MMRMLKYLITCMTLMSSVAFAERYKIYYFDTEQNQLVDTQTKVVGTWDAENSVVQSDGTESLRRQHPTSLFYTMRGNLYYLVLTTSEVANIPNPVSAYTLEEIIERSALRPVSTEDLPSEGKTEQVYCECETPQTPRGVRSGVRGEATRSTAANIATLLRHGKSAKDLLAELSK